MRKVLIFAEKPNQANAYANAFTGSKKKKGYFDIPSCDIFPDGACITYGIGHLTTLKNPSEYQGKESLKYWNLKDLPIIPDRFEQKVTESTKEQFKIVKQLVKEIKQNNGIIIGATDPDREGEGILYQSLSLAGGREHIKKRLWINSLDKDEVIRGFKNLRNAVETYNYYKEAEARQQADWLVGINGTRFYTMMMKNKGITEKMVFSVGRVQSPSLYLIYQRDSAIKNFVSKPFYELIADIKATKGNFTGKLKHKFESELELKNLLEGHNIDLENLNEGKIESVQKESKKELPPSLHSLSSLQTLVNKKYKISPSETLKIVQKLYDSPLQLVSYPRTDTKYITEHEYKYLLDQLDQYQQLRNVSYINKQTEMNKRFVNSKEVKEHYAIVPTRKIPSENELNQLNENELNIYYEIISSVLYMFHNPYLFDETTIITQVKGLQFQTKGKVELSKGWKSIIYKSTDETEKDNVLPEVSEAEMIQSALTVKNGKTTPPKPYTEGDLINMMKTCGKHEDITEEDQKILKEIEGIGTEATRANIIESLKKQEYIEIVKNKVSITQKGIMLCKVIEGTMLSKPETTAKWESYLKAIGKGEKPAQPFVNKTSEQISDLIKKEKETITNSKEVEGIVQTIKVQNKDAITKCPSCNSLIVEKKDFYGCDGYKEGCKIYFSKVFRGKKITKANIKQLCEKKKTNLIKGFKKKDSDKTYDGYLLFDKGQLKFSFK